MFSNWVPLPYKWSSLILRLSLTFLVVFHILWVSSILRLSSICDHHKLPWDWYPVTSDMTSVLRSIPNVSFWLTCWERAADLINPSGELNTYFKQRIIEFDNYKPLEDTVSDKENIKAVAIICKCILCLKRLNTLNGKNNFLCFEHF